MASRSPPSLLSLALPLGSAGALAAAWLLWRRRRRWTEEEALEEALRRIDLAHCAPTAKANEAEYCRAVERWAGQLRRLAGEPLSASLRLAAHAQHLERAAIPRGSYPEGRDGYLRWRAAVKRRQGERVREVLGDLVDGLGEACIARVRDLVAKSLPLRPHACQPGKETEGDAEMQCLEDAACLVFLEQELQRGFPDGKDDAKMVDILQKSWQKMSRIAHGEALRLDLSPRIMGCLAEAVALAELPRQGRPADEMPLPVPSLSAPTRATLLRTWSCCSARFGESWQEELRKFPIYAGDLERVLGFPVCSAWNITKAVQLLLDLLPTAEAAPDGSSEPAGGGPAAAAPRFASVLRATALLAHRFAGLRLRHLDAMRASLVSAVCGLVAEGDQHDAKQCRQAWEAFGYAIGAQMAPWLVLSDSVEEYCGAVASPLPTPGAGPSAAIMTANGIALVEMALGIVLRKHGSAAGNDEDAAKVAKVQGVLPSLQEMRLKALKAARRDAHAFCGLLAAAVFDPAGGDEGLRAARRAPWARRCSAVLLEVATLAVEGATAAGEMESIVLWGARSTRGDLQAGAALLATATELALETAELNLKGNSGDEDLHELAAELRTRAAGLPRLRA